MKTLPNIHPGEVLLEEFLTPMGISRNALARVAGVPPRRINEIVLGKRSVSGDTAVRLDAVLGTSERLWLGQIGRASGRERGRQYAWISVACVSQKKKYKKHN